MDRLDGKETAINRIYNSYKKTAIRKGYDFNLDKFEFLRLVTDRCSYCGVEPQNVMKPSHYSESDEDRWFIYNGIDRVDNTRGYELDNVVSCCSVCNYAKRNMSKDAFLLWVKRIYKYSLAGIEEKTAGMIVDELGTTLIKCFMAQEDIMNPKLSIEDQRLAAIRAQELNARRNKLIRTLDSLLGFEDNTHTAKTYYTYFDNKEKGSE